MTVKTGLRNHLVIIFTELWLLTFHVLLECNNLDGLPKSPLVAPNYDL